MSAADKLNGAMTPLTNTLPSNHNNATKIISARGSTTPTAVGLSSEWIGKVMAAVGQKSDALLSSAHLQVLFMLATACACATSAHT